MRSKEAQIDIYTYLVTEIKYDPNRKYWRNNDVESCFCVKLL